MEESFMMSYNLTVILKCTQSQSRSAPDGKSTYSTADGITSKYCIMKHHTREKDKQRLLYKHNICLNNPWL